MNKLRITAVSYLNTLPFVHGLRHALDKDAFELSLDVPSLCARKMAEGQADIGLVPVGAIMQLGISYKMMDYCLAADGEVSSVLLVSNVPMSEIRNVHLDSDSRTSVLLVRVLASEYWNIQPEWFHLDGNDGPVLPESMVIIGDKAFGIRSKYRYSWDLAAEWKAFTGLPFVFAAWLAKKDPYNIRLRTVNEALEYGINHIDDAITERLMQGPVDIDLKYYLTHCIHFRLDEHYKLGLELFTDYASKMIL